MFSVLLKVRAYFRVLEFSHIDLVTYLLNYMYEYLLV